MRIALPKGRLLKPLLGLLADRGVRFEFRSDRDYRPACDVSGVEAKLIKARVIPQMLALGKFDIGFTCLDVVKEAGYDNVVPWIMLGLNKVRIVVAIHASTPDILTRPPKRPLIIATEYPNLADGWATGRGLAHITVQTTGSTEAYPPEDADIVVDVVETGDSLRANSLIEVETLLESETCAVIRRGAPISTALDAFINRVGQEGD